MIYQMLLILSTDIRLWERDRNNVDYDQRGVFGHFKEVNTCDLVLLETLRRGREVTTIFYFIRDSNSTIVVFTADKVI